MKLLACLHSLPAFLLSKMGKDLNVSAVHPYKNIARIETDVKIYEIKIQ